MTLHLLQVRLDWTRLLQESSTLHAGTDPGYHLHAWSSAVFGPGAAQPFRWVERSSTLYAYSDRDRDALMATATQFAEPRAFEAIRELRTKAMPDRWPAGTRVGFSLRMTPTVRLAADVEGRARKGAEVDAYSAARWREGEAPSRADVYRHWLADQLLRHGDTTLESVEVERYALARMLRRSQGKKRTPTAVTLPDVECTGVAVTGERFAELLARGVGRHRAFGFGMLLLRPPPC